jgi:diguanylate cyclase (GGDEF)-like protein
MPREAAQRYSHFPSVSSEKLIEVAEGLSAIVKLTSELAAANHHRRWSEVNDPLTGIANRTRFWECLSRELALSDAHNFPVSLLMIDIDDLKRMNDTHGHETGDQVLATVGEVLAQELRASDMAGRYTSDSFLALLRGTDETGSQAVAWRLKNKISQCNITASGQDVPIAISIGSVTYPTCAAHDVDSLVREASAALGATRNGSATEELSLAA